MEAHQAARDYLACERSPAHFITQHCHLRDDSGAWIPFDLWPAQADALRVLRGHKQTVWLKARQLGMTWLALCYALHTILFKPGATVLLFSLRDQEAIELLDRLRGICRLLPPHLQPRKVVRDSSHEFALSNGSRAKAFPSNRGDSYTSRLAIIDEADLIPKLDRLLGSVKPTIDAGGQLLLLSRVDKSKPESPFKQIYRAAKSGGNNWGHVFLPWSARPSRTQEWYDREKSSSFHTTGSNDMIYEQYPATDAEALAPRELDKRIPPHWLNQCYAELQPQQVPGMPTVPNFLIFVPPQPGRKYVIGADPAEGNPSSDDSAATVLDAITGEEVARFSGKHEPTTFAHYITEAGIYYNRAMVMVERNNHGHAVIAGIRAINKVRVLYGEDKRLGWLSNVTGKVAMYTRTAEACRDRNVIIHSFGTLTQLQSIEGNTLRAPEGQHDDIADSFALAVVGMPYANREPWRLESF